MYHIKMLVMTLLGDLDIVYFFKFIILNRLSKFYKELEFYMNWAVLEQRSVSWLPSASQSTHETECDLGMYTWFSIHISSCSSCLRLYHPEQAQSHLNSCSSGNGTF